MTVLETLQQMMQKFDPAAAKGVDATVQLNASGAGGGSYAITIRGGQVSLQEGLVEKPTVTINVDASDWVAIVLGTLDPTRAFMTGKLKIAGDLGLMMRFQRIFMS